VACGHPRLGSSRVLHVNDSVLASNMIKFIPSFVETGQLVQWRGGGGEGHIDTYIHIAISQATPPFQGGNYATQRERTFKERKM
jgi:hypothetical protein